jgi:hypothetical protein
MTRLLTAEPVTVDDLKNGRFEGREACSEAEPVFLLRWHAGAFRPVVPACDDASRAPTSVPAIGCEFPLRVTKMRESKLRRVTRSLRGWRGAKRR